MHVFAVALYSVMKGEGFNGEHETFRNFLMRMIHSGKLAAGRVKPIYDAFYSRRASKRGVTRPHSTCMKGFVKGRRVTAPVSSEITLMDAKTISRSGDVQCLLRIVRRSGRAVSIRAS